MKFLNSERSLVLACMKNKTMVFLEMKNRVVQGLAVIVNFGKRDWRSIHKQTETYPTQTSVYVCICMAYVVIYLMGNR